MARVNLFGVGIRSNAPAITAQSRVNFLVERRDEQDRTNFALVSRAGKTLFNGTISGQPSRGMWPVNTLATPLVFTVHSGTLYSVNNAGVATSIGTIGTTSGDVSMVDDGTYLVVVDGSKGYYYDMISPGALTEITDGNFTTSPKTVTWQDQYFIVTSGATNQFQLNNGTTPATWPAVNINFTGTAPGALKAGLADHSILQLFGDVYAEFWQDTGAPDFPYALIPGAAQEFGLASAASLAKFDNTVAGVFQNLSGAVNISRMSGFRLERISDDDIDDILSTYSTVSDAVGFAYTIGQHAMYRVNFPTAGTSWEYDAATRVWSQMKSTTDGREWGNKFANFQNRLLVSDYRNGNIYQMSGTTYTDNGSNIPCEVTSKHIWSDDKYIGIHQLQIDVQPGVGLATGQGSDPQMMLLISKDGGNSFNEVGWSSIGKVGEYTNRCIWKSLGSARDWVLRLRITDPVQRVITGASAEIVGGAF